MMVNEMVWVSENNWCVVVWVEGGSTRAGGDRLCEENIMQHICYIITSPPAQSVTYDKWQL